MADPRVRCVHPEAGEALFTPAALASWGLAKGWRDASIPPPRPARGAGSTTPAVPADHEED